MSEPRDPNRPAKYTPGRAASKSRPGRESVSKRLGKVAAQIRERDGHACVYCRATAEESGAHLHFDHLTPRDAGGADAASNLVLACRRCNRAKSALSLRAWAVYAQVKLGLLFSPRSVRAQARRRLP